MSKPVEVNSDDKYIKVKASLSRVFFPKTGVLAGDANGNNPYGIATWSVFSVEEGDPVMNFTGEITVVGNYIDPIDPVNTYVILAKEVENEKYGLQYQLVYANRDYDFSKLRGQRTFLRTFMTELQIEEMFKIHKNPIEVIANHDIEGLKKVKGIGDYIANRIINSFEEVKDKSEVYIELDNMGLTQNFINKLIQRYHAPQKVVRMVKENPYGLIKDVEGVGFSTADKIALAGSFTESCKERIMAYITWYLDTKGESGHSYVSAGELLGAIYGDLGGKEVVYEELIDPDTGEATNNISLAMSMLEEQGEIVLEKEGSKASRRVYLTSYYNLEKKIAYHLKRILDGHNEMTYEGFDEKIAYAENAQGFKFTQEQLDGIKLGVEKQVCVISGLAGTGKSSLVSGVLAVLNEYSFAQCALSGKAAARLQEVTGQEGFTIHRLLGFGAQGAGYFYHENNPLPYNIIILDEISLVGGDVFLRLLEAIPTGAKLIMLGDMGQLEAIGALNIASDLCNSGEIPLVHLQQVHRQAKASGILTTAYDVRNQIQVWPDGEEGTAIRGELRDMIFDISLEKDDNRKKVLAYFEKCYNGVLVNKDIEKIQVIAPVKERGDACVFNLNQDIQELINPVDGIKPNVYIKKKPDSSGADKSFWIQEGDKVMCIKNNYRVYDAEQIPSAIYNGWTGIVTGITEQDVWVKFYLASKPIALPIKDVNSYLVLGYASTVHKLQGSSADVVIGVLDYSTPPLMLTCQLIYTLLTRAKKRCFLIAQGPALKKAINSNYVSTKRTFLPEFLNIPTEELRKWYSAFTKEEREKKLQQIADKTWYNSNDVEVTWGRRAQDETRSR